MDPDQLDQDKQLAVSHSLEFVKNAIIKGLGTGSAAAHMKRGWVRKSEKGSPYKPWLL